MRARDLMTTDLVTVTPETRVSDVAHLLAARGISAVPVVTPEGGLLGIVTEADLVRRLAGGTPGGGWFAGLIGRRPGDTAESYARLHGQRAEDVMTTDLVTVEEDTPAERIAQVMEQRRVKRVPVLREGRLAGIVSRADLLGLAFSAPAEPATEASDTRIRRAVEKAIREQPWADAYLVFPSVQDGIVTFHGWCRSPAVPRALRVLAEAMPGVRGVELKLHQPPAFLLGVP